MLGKAREMLTMQDRARLVFAEAWRLWPPSKTQAWLTDVRLADLGAVHGTYHPETGVLDLNPRLVAGAVQMLPLIDIDGASPPRRYPVVSRALHTALHEIGHAVLYGLCLDDHPEWLALSGWVHADDDPPGTARYVERRPGWEPGRSDWRYRTGGTFFTREYASRSPYEDAADLCAHLCLGWTDTLAAPNARTKRDWLRAHVWEERGTRRITATAARWRTQVRHVRTVWAGHQEQAYELF